MAVGKELVDVCKVVGEIGVHLGDGLQLEDASALLSIPAAIQGAGQIDDQFKALKRADIQKVGNFFYDVGFLIKDIADGLISKDNALVKLNALVAELGS